MGGPVASLNDGFNMLERSRSVLSSSDRFKFVKGKPKPGF